MATSYNLKEIYGNSISSLSSRRDEVEAQFCARYRSVPEKWFSSPGRAEVVGNHTDHNLGKVLVSAVSCDILCAASPREKTAEIVSLGFHAVHIDLDDLDPHPREKGKSAAFVRGVLAYLKKHGYAIGGFEAVSHSNIFRGAGVSSSAAFGVLIAQIENVLHLGGVLTPVEMAKAAQYAENVYFGKPSGLLDQMGVARGGLSAIDFENLADPKCESVPVPERYTLVLTNTGGSHAGLTAHYAAIKDEMLKVAAHFGKKHLREVRYADVLSEINPLRSELGERAVLRAMHFFEENERVDRAVAALRAGDDNAFLEQVRASGESSLRWLQNCCVPGKTAQPFVLALKISEGLMKEGAFRMMGGGFTGTVLAFCKKGTEREYGEGMAKVFGSDSVFYTDMRPVGTIELNF